MPIRPPALDDRSFDDLVTELVARIPAHSPEYANPRLGDPGRTLIDLFAWLGDTILYRANLIPERQRLAFLRLIGAPMRAAIAATGIVSVFFDDPKITEPVSMRPGATLKGPVPFETRGEVMVLPINAEGFCKRPASSDELAGVADLLPGLDQVYGLQDQAKIYYVTTPVFPGGAMEPDGFDLAGDTVDGKLWLALLASDASKVAAVQASLGAAPQGQSRLLSVGMVPALAVPVLFEDIGPRKGIACTFELTTGREIGGAPELVALQKISDTTAGGTRRGVVRLEMPSADRIGAPENDVRKALAAGLGPRPPRVDDPKLAQRIVAWLRIGVPAGTTRFPLSWIGINAVEIDQRQTITGRVVGQSDGTADQIFQLPGQSVEKETLDLQIEETGSGFQSWQSIDDIALAGRDASAYELDAEAGTVRLGDGVRGRIPDATRRVRVGTMRSGGGGAGNVPAGTLTRVSGYDLNSGQLIDKPLKVQQSLATDGGQDSETLDQAEARIPAMIRHRDRAVTEDDYRRVAADTPGIELGRVELLPRFKPQQRRFEVPGVVSVMVLPAKAAMQPPNPRPDRLFLEAVHGWLDDRRQLATELYTIGCEYVPLALAVGVTLRDGFAGEEVMNAVRDALRRFLWSLSPGGIDGGGWPLGRAVNDRELAVVVAGVPGIDEVDGINLFDRAGDGTFQMVRRPSTGATVRNYEAWQLPELLQVVVVEGDPPTDIAPDVSQPGGIAVPVVPEVC
jgi:hypothetical protein